jgi:hypothetical protein
LKAAMQLKAASKGVLVSGIQDKMLSCFCLAISFGK